VVRFDNRDVGASTHLDGVRVPKIRDIALKRKKPPYTLDDMADDAAGLVEALGLGPVHVVGASLGGFIAQTLALRHPALVRSLTLIMTSTGSRLKGQADPRLLGRLLKGRQVSSREEAGEAAVETFRAIGSPGFVLDEERMRDVGRRSYDRGHDAWGYRRQLACGRRAAEPHRRLSSIAVPTLVLHGLHDPLVAPSGGVALATHIPGARFVGFAGMGHDLPRDLWPEFADAITALTRRADGAQEPVTALSPRVVAVSPRRPRGRCWPGAPVPARRACRPRCGR
jgi:pimeloyl-ACP methyl ester carboxylesterase